ncbi:lysophospholipid acyltransferase family protein [Haliangium ochraceum]|uniref:Phospholipid/glycerol acyltransferase n=1 Tax=Haliangium ochraceum (strain DSM 14365 / JCM 11303 / SMP-2) TaxID=502025 RepID=D0LVE5_HALO1|nr:lysophospholipid acyltransferase family protein [Haliangium ochraceum]ACY17506.1 phospholipid/glycerol acyltransferase [Haliangium ochraceum DSM 14365]
MPWLVSDDVFERTAQLEVPFSRHGIDPFGISRVEVARMMTVLSWLYRHYFTMRVSGLDNVPDHGRVLLIGNHSGGWGVDAMMTIAALFLEKEPPRLAHAMADRFINRMPFASLYTARTGNLTGTPRTAAMLLESERALMVFPEGWRGTAKLYGDRNSLVRFGNGFMRLALHTKTPIVPFAFVGGGDAIPTVVNLYRVGKLLGMPYIPITPYVLPLPRPVALQLNFGEPMHFAGTGNEDDHEVATYVGEVKNRIAVMLENGQRRRLAKGLGR